MNTTLRRRFSEKDLRQERFRKVIDEYTKLFATEFDAFKRGISEKIEGNATKYAELKGSDMIQRQIFEMPETLNRMLKVALSDEDYEVIKTKEGARWFARTFADFRVSEKV